jgi:hypothetical protein
MKNWGYQRFMNTDDGPNKMISGHGLLKSVMPHTALTAKRWAVKNKSPKRCSRVPTLRRTVESQPKSFTAHLLPKWQRSKFDAFYLTLGKPRFPNLTRSNSRSESRGGRAWERQSKLNRAIQLATPRHSGLSFDYSKSSSPKLSPCEVIFISCQNPMLFTTFSSDAVC